MPRVSKRNKVLIALRALMRRRLVHRVIRKRRGDCNVKQDVVDRIIKKKLKELESSTIQVPKTSLELFCYRRGYR